MDDAIDRARNAFGRRAWAVAHELLAAEDAREALGAEDLERLAVAAYLVGRDDESARAWERAHHALLADGHVDHAARCAFWLGLGFLLAGRDAQAGGWMARAHRLVDDGRRPCAASGYLRVPAALQAMAAGDPAAALVLATEAGSIAERFGDADLLALARLTEGEATLALGDVSAGLTLLDEVMVSVIGDELTVVTAGIVYCAVIEACMAVFDLRRAAEWTGALARWCDDQPDLVPYRGQCLVHRAQILQARGDWAAAAAAADRACASLGRPPHPALAVALYQQGELHRLRGEHEAAERAYRGSARHGRDPAPGWALLQLATGRVDAAAAAIRRMAAEVTGPWTRPPVLAASTEILLAAGDVAGARAAADELAAIAATTRAPVLLAMSGHATGAVLLASGDARSALRALRSAAAAWQAQADPYEVARVRVLVARACAALGDLGAAAAEVEAARTAFASLGARSELARLATGPQLAVPTAVDRRPAATAPLTAREREVLQLVATGLTNRDVGAALCISEHTVARHLQNIFTKTGCSSRTAAVAHALRHDIA